MREKRSRHIVDAFFSWCDAEAPSVLDDTPISAGIRYARNQRVGLAKFIEDGRLPIHNNMSELALRREAVGRKNWALRRQRRWRSRKRDLHLAPRERPALQDRTVGVPARSLLPALELAGAPDARSRSAELGADERS